MTPLSHKCGGCCCGGNKQKTCCPGAALFGGSPFWRGFFRVASFCGLSVVVLPGMRAAYAHIASSDLYKVLGEVPNQEVHFHNDACFDLFLIRVAELFAEGRNNVTIAGTNLNFSLFSAVKWLCKEHPDESCIVGLDVACQNLANWL